MLRLKKNAPQLRGSMPPPKRENPGTDTIHAPSRDKWTPDATPVEKFLMPTQTSLHTVPEAGGDKGGYCGVPRGVREFESVRDDVTEAVPEGERELLGVAEGVKELLDVPLRDLVDELEEDGSEVEVGLPLVVGEVELGVRTPPEQK